MASTTNLDTQQPGGSVNQIEMQVAISDEMVRVYKDQFGRGPTKARTTFCGRDTVTVVLEKTFTPAELNLAKMGEHQRLRDVRLFFQYSREQEIREPIERITGRRVRAFISGIDTAADVALEFFILEPEESSPMPANGSASG